MSPLLEGIGFRALRMRMPAQERFQSRDWLGTAKNCQSLAFGTCINLDDTDVMGFC